MKECLATAVVSDLNSSPSFSCSQFDNMSKSLGAFLVLPFQKLVNFAVERFEIESLYFATRVQVTVGANHRH